MTLQIDSSPRLLGASTLRCAPIAYGFWRFAGTDVKSAREKVELALELGIDLFDHADIYGVDGGGSFGDAELLFGKVLKEAPSLRERFVLATKGGIVLGLPYDSSAKYIREAVDASLTRLGVDVIDLYQIHRPDFLGHPAELAEVLSALRAEGKIREVGVSNYTTSQTRALQAHLPFSLVTSQPEFSCIRHHALRDGTLDLCLETGITPLAWSPLAGGSLGLSRDEAAAQPNGEALVACIDVLDRIAQEQSVSRAAVAIAWTMLHPSKVMPILGTQNPTRLRACMDATRVQMTRAQWNEVLVAAQGEPLP